MSGSRPSLGLYVSRQASSTGRYIWEQLFLALFGWIPTVLGIAVRSVVYRLIMRLDGTAAIEKGVRIRFADQIRLGRGVYLDEGAYLHACPGGIQIGENTLVMHHAELHVYNFRDLPRAGIRIGRDSLVGEFNVLRGQMSLAGPRPERPEFVEDLKKTIPYYDERHAVKPGVTGWAQLKYSYGASEEDAIEKLQYDLYYIKNQSLMLDIMIILQTVEVVLWGKGAR